MTRWTLWMAWIVAAWLVLMGIATFYDLQISQTVAQFEAGWAQVLQLYGQIPGLVVALLGAAVLLRVQPLQKTARSMSVLALLILANLVAGVILWLDIFGMETPGAPVQLGPALPCALLTVAALQWGLRRVPAGQLERWKGPALVAVLLLFAAPILTTWLIKLEWGRWTYRDLVASGDLSLFTPWYLPGGSNGHHSFPSGHTSFSFLVLPLTLLAPKGWRSGLVWTGVLLFAGAVMASRVVIGAHFFSDVLASAAFSIGWFIGLTRWVLKPAAAPGLQPAALSQ